MGYLGKNLKGCNRKPIEQMVEHPCHEIKAQSIDVLVKKTILLHEFFFSCTKLSGKNLVTTITITKNV